MVVNSEVANIYVFGKGGALEVAGVPQWFQSTLLGGPGLSRLVELDPSPRQVSGSAMD